MSIPEFNAFSKFVPAQIALSAVVSMGVNVCSLPAAPVITMLALQAIGLVAATALLLDLAAAATDCDLMKWIPFYEDKRIGYYQEVSCLARLQLIATVGLFAMGYVAAPIAYYGLMCEAAIGLANACLYEANKVAKKIVGSESTHSQSRRRVRSGCDNTGYFSFRKDQQADNRAQEPLVKAWKASDSDVGAGRPEPVRTAYSQATVPPAGYPSDWADNPFSEATASYGSQGNLLDPPVYGLFSPTDYDPYAMLDNGSKSMSFDL